MTQGILERPRPTVSSRALVEFLLVGGATLLFFPISYLMRRSLGLDDAEYAAGFLTFYAAFAINDPHFTVTYLLFYRNVKQRVLSPEVPLTQRARYAFAGFVAPAILAGWAIGALSHRSAQSLGWMVQLMFLLVGWHYVKQGFGVLTVLSARRGIRFSTRERRVILWHCFSGWAFAWANPAMPAGWFEERGVIYWALAHPRALELTAAGVLAASTVALGVVLVQKWRRERTLPFAPLAGLLITIWLWSIYSALDPVVRYVIPALHSVQYLYFVWLLKRGEARERSSAFGASVTSRLAVTAVLALLLGWLLFHGLPEMVDGALARAWRKRAPGALGATPAVCAFYVFINLHHYLMDTVIWRRDNPDTRYLQI